ncbi:MAG TPA: RdgB/HAM1 family non-canonical purine NTP pyrophosphatase [Gemmatimonadaceae bacterium]|nr:RdgB/HAM1 family non-canonical purine NTP pyrophosphatase [Gemmatimonadaceae bacterium]
MATRSEGKLRELRSLFATYEIAVVDLRDAGIAESLLEESLEAHATFEENALAKARHFHRVSGRPTVADDSGLVVATLDGRPGVLSKRWSGRTDLSGQALDDENNRLLVRSLQNAQDRRASYVCAAAFVDDEREFVCRGEVHGRILEAPRGNGGFGYDPYFFSTELGRTFAEVSGAEKARVSHRGRAFRALVERLGIGG